MSLLFIQSNKCSQTSAFCSNVIIFTFLAFYYYSKFSSLFPDFFFAIVFYSPRRVESDKKKSRDIKK